MSVYLIFRIESILKYVKFWILRYDSSQAESYSESGLVVVDKGANAVLVPINLPINFDQLADHQTIFCKCYLYKTNYLVVAELTILDKFLKA